MAQEVISGSWCRLSLVVVLALATCIATADHQEVPDPSLSSDLLWQARRLEAAPSANGNFAKAAELYNEAARLGELEAMYRLGWLHFYGRGLPQSAEQAVEWWRRGAEAGHTQSMVQLGEMHRVGVAVEHDPNETIRWWLRAAEAGDTNAMVRLGAAYRDGGLVQPDLEEAVRWFRQGVDLGDPHAMMGYGSIYSRFDSPLGHDPEKDLEWTQKGQQRAFEMYRERVRSDDPDAMVQVAWAYLVGHTGAVDRDKAYGWYLKAAERGNTQAIRSILIHFVDEDDDAQSLEWTRRGVELGDPTFMASLARRYETGRGVEQDLAEAARWYRKAAELGDGFSRMMLGRMYRDGRGLERDRERAAYWLERAMEVGEPFTSQAGSDLEAMEAEGRRPTF